MNSLTPFRVQPDGVNWPTHEWPTTTLDASVNQSQLNSALAALFDHGVNPPAGQGVSLATLVVHRGAIVAERYGVQPDTAFGPGGPVDQDTTLISWSMAKSMTQAVLAIVIEELEIDVDAPVDIAEWANDERRRITLVIFCRCVTGSTSLKIMLSTSRGIQFHMSLTCCLVMALKMSQHTRVRDL